MIELLCAGRKFQKQDTIKKYHESDILDAALFTFEIYIHQEVARGDLSQEDARRIIFSKGKLGFF